MARQRAAVLAVVAAAACVLPVASAGSAKRCTPPRSHLIVKDSAARIYKIFSHADGDLHEVWGCSLRTGHRTYLGSRDFRDFEANTLARSRCGDNSSLPTSKTPATRPVSTLPSPFDLATGRRLHRWSQGGGACTGQTGGDAHPSNPAEVQPRGSQSSNSGCGPTTQEVFKADGKRTPGRQLPPPRRPSTHYLVVMSGRVYWKDNGQTRGAPLH